jgi:hypothetical protein
MLRPARVLTHAMVALHDLHLDMRVATLQGRNCRVARRTRFTLTQS